MFPKFFLVGGLLQHSPTICSSYGYSFYLIKLIISLEEVIFNIHLIFLHPLLFLYLDFSIISGYQVEWIECVAGGAQNHEIDFQLAQIVLFYIQYISSELQWLVKTVSFMIMHPRPGRHISDQQLTTNFELWVKKFCVPTCFHMRIPKPCLSVPREKKSP